MAKDRGPALRQDRPQRGQRASTRPRAAAGGILVVGALAAAEPPVGPSSSHFPAVDGITALRLLQHSGLASAIGIVVCDAELPDMTGTGLLGRVSALLPHCARVLLVEPDDALPSQEQLLALGVDDAWTTPPDLAALLARVERERPALAHIRALHRRLDETRRALDRLEARYRTTRSARDRLAASVRDVLAEDIPGPARQRLERWWRDYRTCVELRESRCPVHRRPASLGVLVDDALARMPPPRADLADWRRGPPAPLRGQVNVDPSLMSRTLIRLFGGLAEIGAPGAGLQLATVPAPRGRRRLRVFVDRIEPSLQGGSADLIDPFARLPDGALHRLSLDLVVAAALCEVQAQPFELQPHGEGLAVVLDLPVAAGIGLPARGPGAAPVVPDTDATL